MQILQLFSVPLVEFTHHEAESLCPGLASFFLAHEDDRFRDDRKRDTQLGPVFETRFDLFYWKDPEVQPMVEFIHGAVARTVARLNGYTAKQMESLKFEYHAWFHVTRTGGFQGTHNHPNASWSGIFCIDPGEPPVRVT